MHSFEVNIRICQSDNSDVHRGLTNPDVRCLSFPTVIKFINLLKSDVPCVLKTRLS